MIVLGLFGYGMNPSACLLIDGKLVAFAEEERFTRYKVSTDLFPSRAAAFVLTQAGINLQVVTKIAFAWDANVYPYGMLKTLAKQFFRHRRRSKESPTRGGGTSVLTGLATVLKYVPRRLEQDIYLGLREPGLVGARPPIEFVPHHLSHSYSTYYCSPFSEAIVLTIDGSGEDQCTQVAVGRGGELEVVETIGLPDSLGWFYGAFTAYFGFKPYRHEGKLMALAALGQAGNPWFDRLEEVLSISETGYCVDPIYTRLGAHSYSARFSDNLAQWVTRFDAELEPLAHGEVSLIEPGKPRYMDQGYRDLAWAVQARLEAAAKTLAVHHARKNGIKNLCIAGGVGLNCKMNGRLLEDSQFDAVFVQPASNDAGTAIGAAMVVAHSHGDSIRNEMQNAYLGPGYSDDEIRVTLEECGARFNFCEDIAERVASEIAQNRVVGWFQGRMEAGPRALGARSILANPQASDIQKRLGLSVKRREVWRPFCPSILSEYKQDYFENAAESPFMTTAFQVREERREEMRAVMHVDGSARPQTVSEKGSPLFHSMLTHVHKLTGLPFVINTSFNVNGEPIVCSPLDAIRCFYSSGLDVLALGNFVLTKE